MGATVTWGCACTQCACIAPVPTASSVCGNCASGAHHNMINK